MTTNDADGTSDNGQSDDACSENTVAGTGADLDQVSSAALGSARTVAEDLLRDYFAQPGGTVEWSGEGGGIAGASFAMGQHRLGSGTCEALEAMVAGALDSERERSGVETEAAPLSDSGLAALTAAFDAWRLRPAEDQPVVAAIQRAVGGVESTHPELEIFSVKGATSTQRLGGVAFVDPSTREVFWLYGHAVHMTSHIR